MLRKAKRLSLGGAALESTVNSLGVQPEFFAPIRQDHPPAAVLHPSCITADIRHSLRGDFLGNTESLKFGPPSLQAASDKEHVNIESIGPVCDAHRFSTYGSHTINPTISLLLLPACPHAVPLGVPEAVIHTFYRMTFRWLPHVSQEVREITPLLANRDSSPAVVCPLFTVFVSASLNDAVPSVVRPSVRSAVSGTHLGPNLSGETPTTLSFPGCEVLRGSNGGVSTLTNAVPPFLCIGRNRRKPTKNRPRSHRVSACCVAGVAAKKSVFGGEVRAGKRITAMGANLGDDRHRASKKMMKVF